MSLTEPLFLLAQTIQPCPTGSSRSDCAKLPQVDANQGQITTVLEIAFGIIGAVSVVFIIIASLSLVTSVGDPEALKKARRTIMYAVIGLVIAISAEAIIMLVLNRI